MEEIVEHVSAKRKCHLKLTSAITNGRCGLDASRIASKTTKSLPQIMHSIKKRLLVTDSYQPPNDITKAITLEVERPLPKYTDICNATRFQATNPDQLKDWKEWVTAFCDPLMPLYDYTWWTHNAAMLATSEELDLPIIVFEHDPTKFTTTGFSHTVYFPTPSTLQGNRQYRSQCYSPTLATFTGFDRVLEQMPTAIVLILYRNIIIMRYTAKLAWKLN
jgi:hypothetical protein